MHDFERWTRAHFGATPPLGFCLRVDHPERWSRFHSLPDAKRYADTEAEHAEVRMRAWATAAEVLPDGAPVWLVALDEAHVALPPSLRPERVGPYRHPLLDAPTFVTVARTSWPHDGFDPLIAAVARDEARCAWFASRTGEVFAPYDGGIDLLLESPRRAAAVRRMFADWLSPRPDGL